MPLESSIVLQPKYTQKVNVFMRKHSKIATASVCEENEFIVSWLYLMDPSQMAQGSVVTSCGRSPVCIFDATDLHHQDLFCRAHQ